MSSFKITGESRVEDSVFDRQQRISWWSQDELRQARVMVVGAGAIGNEVLKNLALLGVGYMFVVDFDDISSSNLSRTVLFRSSDLGKSKAETAARRVRDLCLEPAAAVDAFHGDLVWDLGTGIFRQMDVVLGCVDNVEARLAVNRQCWLAGVPWIDAGIHELAGHVSVFLPPDSPCYECAASPQQLKSAQVRYSCDNFKRRLMAEGRAPTVQVASALVASLQVQEAVKLLHERSSMAGKSLIFQGTINDFDTIELPRKEICTAHASYPAIEELPFDTTISLRALLEHLEASLGAGARLDLSDDRAFVRRVRCRGCGRWIDLDAPDFRLYDSDTICPACVVDEGAAEAPAEEVPTDKESISIFDLETTPSEVLDMSLRAVGVPFGHVVPVLLEHGEHKYFELSGDLPAVLPGLHRRTEEDSTSN